MRSKKTLKNIKVDLFVTISIVLLGFLSRKVFIDHMGADVTGLMLLFVQLIGMINIAEMGVGTATASLLYKPLSNNDSVTISKIVSSTAKIYNIISLLVLLIGTVTGVVVYYSIPAVSEIKYSSVFWMLYVINTAASYLFAHYLILLTADQKYYITRTIQGGAKIVCVAIQLASIILFKSFLVYILCETFFLAIQYFLFRKQIRTSYELHKIKDNYVESTEFCEIKKRIKNVFFHKIGGVLVFNTDYLIISRFLNLTAVTIYSSYMMIFQALAMIVNILGNSVTASVGNYLTNKNAHEKKVLWDRIIILFFFIATCMTLITFLTITNFVRLWIGSEYILDEYTLYFLLANLFILISRVAIDIIKNASGEFSDIYLPLIEGIINVMLSVLLVREFGFIGVIIGTLVSNVIIICLAKPIYLYRRILHGSVSGFLLSMAKPIILTAVSVLTVSSYSRFWTYTDNLYIWGAEAVLAGMITVATVSVIFSISSDFRYVIRRVLSLLIAKK